MEAGIIVGRCPACPRLDYLRMLTVVQGYSDGMGQHIDELPWVNIEGYSKVKPFPLTLSPSLLTWIVGFICI